MSKSHLHLCCTEQCPLIEVSKSFSRTQLNFLVSAVLSFRTTWYQIGPRKFLRLYRRDEVNLDYVNVIKSFLPRIGFRTVKPSRQVNANSSNRYSWALFRDLVEVAFSLSLKSDKRSGVRSNAEKMTVPILSCLASVISPLKIRNALLPRQQT